jgi:hypothetical protein
MMELNRNLLILIAGLYCSGTNDILALIEALKLFSSNNEVKRELELLYLV